MFGFKWMGAVVLTFVKRRETAKAFYRFSISLIYNILCYYLYPRWQIRKANWVTSLKIKGTWQVVIWLQNAVTMDLKKNSGEFQFCTVSILLCFILNQSGSCLILQCHMFVYVNDSNCWKFFYGFLILSKACYCCYEIIFRLCFHE